MAHNGKIACHFPAAGNPNHDVYGIKFLPVGGNTSNLLTVDKVYYLSPTDIAAMKAMSSDAERLAYLTSTSPTHRVWELMPSLTAGNQTVVFEYTPSADVSLTSLGIFTDSTDTNTTCNVAIYHESGLVVYKHNADTIDGTETVHDLQGKKHHINGISGVTLKGGLKYYIQYTQETDNNHTTFYPAYYDGTAGNYKVWYHGSVQNKQTVNMANFNKYWGLLDDSSRIFRMEPGDFFIWNGNSNIGMTVGNCYVRSNVATSPGYIFTGVIGDVTSPYYHQFSESDLSDLLDKPFVPDPDNPGSYLKPEFIWYVTDISGFSSGDVLAKTQNVNKQNTTLMDFTTYTQQNPDYYKTAGVLLEIYNGNSPMFYKGNFWNSSGSRIYLGDKFTLKSGYSSKVTSMTPLTSLPSNPQNGEIYFIAAGVISGSYSWTDCCYVYSNGNWTAVVDDWYNYFDLIGISTWLEKRGRNQDLTSETYDSNRISASLRDNTTYPIQTGRKYYLEINGKEV